MADDDDIVQVVDEIVDDMDPLRIENEINRLGIPLDTLLQRVLVELKDRLDN
jgi:hypothetical protein